MCESTKFEVEDNDVLLLLLLFYGNVRDASLILGFSIFQECFPIIHGLTAYQGCVCHL